MKRKFTFLIAAAVMLLTMVATTSEMWGQTTVTQTSFTAISGNVNNDLNVSYAAYKGGGTSNPAVNSNAIRLYQNLNGNTGGYVVIGVPNDYVITSATIQSTMATTTGYKLTDTDPGSTTPAKNTFNVSNHSLSANTDYTVDDISTQYITFACFGTSSSSRLYLSKISITYQSTGGGSDPSISADDVNITYDATEGGIAYTINNPVEGGAISATVTSGDWLTLGQGTDSPIAFTCSANDISSARTATVRLTYTYSTKATVTKDVTITQAAAPVIYTTIPEIFAAATATETDVHVTFDNWVVSGVSTNGKNVYVTDGTNGLIIYYTTDMSTTFSAGNVLNGENVSCTLKLYNGAAELLNVDASDLTITTGGTVTPADIAMADLTGVNTGALLHYENLTCSFNNNKYFLTDGTTSIQLYNSLYAFTNPTVGNTYNITGVYAQYNTTKEIMPRSAADIEEVLPTEPSITVANATVNVEAEGGEGTLTVTYENITNVAAEVWFCNAAGTASATYDWIIANINSTNNVDYLIEDNDGEARTAYFKVWAYDDNLEEVYSNIVTVTQAEYIAPTYAELPFSFNGGRADIENTDGLYQDGLGTDYSASTSPNTKLRFDNTNDWLLLQFSERPGTLTFSIKNNSFSEGTFKLQTSIDGTTFVDLKTYTDAVLIGTLNEEFTELNENVRYIKWVYTDRQSGNVGLGNISLTEYVEPAASITVTPELVDATIAETEGYLGIAYIALNITQADDFGIQFYDNNSQELNGDDEPNWIQAEAATQIGQEGYFVYYVISANTGAARSAYFKVYALDNNAELVYSNLVTVNQAAVPSPVINAEDIEIGYDATSGEIAYTITNPTTATLTATSTEEWISNITVTTDKVTFSSTINEGNTNRIGTITLSYEGAENKAVTVTQGHQVVDYAILPFEWAGGASADFLALAGVSAYGLDSDYGSTHSPYNIKFDGTDDYIQVKTDSQPAKVTIGVKMVGGGNTSYINIQESSDGTNFTDVQELTISGSSNDIVNLATTEDFASTTRYVRMVFTKGSNVGVGPIAITKYTTDPIINAEDVNITCDATNGSIAYTISNPVVGGVLTASTTSEWLVLGSVTTSVPFTCTANTTEENRSATVTLTYTYNTSETVTKDVTVTQSKVDYATLPFAFDKGRNDIENTAGLTQDGLDTDYSSSPKLKFNTAGDWIILKLNAAPVSLSYDIKGNGFSGGTFTVQTSANGTDYYDLAIYTELGDVQSITHVDLDASVRYIKWTYTSKSNGNVALGNIHATDHYDTYGDVTFNDLDLTAASESLIIHSGSVVTVNGELTNNNPDNLIIEDGGQVVVNNAGVQATFKKSVAHSASKDAANWYTISSPVNNIAPGSVTNLIQATPANYDLYYYDEATTTWFNHKAAGHAVANMTNGKGYLYWNTDGDELSFPGELNSGTVEIAVTKTGTGDLAGFNLIGNPYSHNIYKGDGTAIPNSILSAGYYTLSNAGAWTAGTDNTTAIKPGQGILVKATAAGTVTMTNTTANGAKRNNEFIKFMIANSQYEDVAYALFNDEEGLNKINHRNANIPMLYIAQNDENYAIATMSDETQSFNLNFKAMTTGQYTLSYKAEGNYDYLHVIDRMTGEDIDMLLDGEYSFIASPSDNDARFIVKLGYNTNNSAENDIFAYQNGSDIVVNGEGELQVFDVTGRMVATQHVNGVQTVNVPSQGVFIFKLNEKTQKIVVR